MTFDEEEEGPHATAAASSSGRRPLHDAKKGSDDASKIEILNAPNEIVLHDKLNAMLPKS